MVGRSNTGPESVILTGITGAGKSTVGEKLARRTRRLFVDADDFIEKKHRRTIEQMFEDGESYFRALESFALRQLLKRSGTIIASGGGAFVQDKNRPWMLAEATVVWLDVPFELAVDHIRNDNKRVRPLAKNLDDPEKLEAFRRLYHVRYPLYQKAHVHIDASLPLDKIVEQIVRNVPQLKSTVS
jgi:shikimate kinase